MVKTHPLSNAANKFSAKFAPKRDGPYIIIRRHGPASYEVSNPSTPTEIASTYRTFMLTPYKEDNATMPLPVRPIRKRGRPRKIETPSTLTVSKLRQN